MNSPLGRGPGRLLAVAALVSVLPACSALPGGQPSDPEPTVVTSPAVPAPSGSTSGSAGDSATPASASPSGSTTPESGTPSALGTPSAFATPGSTPGGTPGPSASDAPPVLDQQAVGRDLTLADFIAAPEEWRDGTFDVASERGLTGVSGPLRTCTEDDAKAETLELRLANSFRRVSMRFGQANDSEGSDAEVLVRLVGNGRFLDSGRARFNQLQTLTVPVPDVNALKIEVYLTGDQCSSDKSVNAVITGLRVE